MSMGAVVSYCEGKVTRHVKGARIAAIYTFAAHYHSGQGSRGYRLMCRAETAWRRHAGIGPRLEYWESVVELEPDALVSTIYRRLVADYAREA
jgi:hypothetical protein